MERAPVRRSIALVASVLALGTCVPRTPDYVIGMESACEEGVSSEITRQRVMYAARNAARNEDIDLYTPLPLLEDCPPEVLDSAIRSIESTGKGSARREAWRMVRILSTSRGTPPEQATDTETS